jgi:tetratricopeptide (TPR) repeat protein
MQVFIEWGGRLMKEQLRWLILALLLACFNLPLVVEATEVQSPADINTRMIADCTAAIVANPGDASEYHRRGLAYFAEGNYALALNDYNQAIAINPDTPVIFLDRGYLYEKMGQAAAAIDDYSRSIACDPRYVVAYDHRGFMYNRTGRSDLALIDCSKALELNPQYVPAYLNKGTAYEKLHMYQEAIETYQALLAFISPQDRHGEEAKKRIRALGGTAEVSL